MAAVISYIKSLFGGRKAGEGIMITYDMPDPYLDLPVEVQKSGYFCPDFCWYKASDGSEHHFINGCIEIAMHGKVEPLIFGVWVSVDDESINRYVDTLTHPNESDIYYGYLSNELPHYLNTYGLKVRLHPRKGYRRPKVEIAEYEHQLSIDSESGISFEKATKFYDVANQNLIDACNSGGMEKAA